MAYPATYNISYYQGDLCEFTITPKTANGTEFDLTDYSVKFYIATARGTGATQYECNAEISGNTITCQIPGGTGKNLAAGTTYVYDVQIKRSSESGPDRIHTLLTGNITVTADVTRMSGD